MTRFHSEKAGSTGVASRDLTVMNARPGPSRSLLPLFVVFRNHLASWLAAARRAEPAARLTAPAAAATASAAKKRDTGKRVTDYHLKGVVKKVDLARGSVMIAHEAIPGFMAAMTMPFLLRRSRRSRERRIRRRSRRHSPRRGGRRRRDRATSCADLVVTQAGGVRRWCSTSPRAK